MKMLATAAATGIAAMFGSTTAIASQQAPAAPLAPSEIAAQAPAADWRMIAPEDLLVMDLAPDSSGRVRRVVIQLMPAPFAQRWVGNIRTLVKARWWDGTSVNRVQDNYVAQWGDATEKKPLPARIVKVAEADYVVGGVVDSVTGSTATATPMRPPVLSAMLPPDPYARGGTGFHAGFPIARASLRSSGMWPVHCYGMVGVGRNLSPDTGTGAELYTVIGHAPRHLDRNIALVGRVIEGIEHLSSLPRGTEALGFYKTAQERVPIRSVRLVSELPAGARPRFEYLASESASFARYAQARANRRDAFFNVPAGGADICNIPVPIRRAR